MTIHPHRAHRVLVVLCAAMLSAGLGVGCVGGSEPSAASAGLLGPDAGMIAASRWHQAPAGCEGLVPDGDIHIGWAEGEAGLGVVLSRGTILCVDSWAAIEAELDRLKGDPAPDPMLPRNFDAPNLE